MGNAGRSINLPVDRTNPLAVILAEARLSFPRGIHFFDSVGKSKIFDIVNMTIFCHIFNDGKLFAFA
jgi:hypothetical protein